MASICNFHKQISHSIINVCHITLCIIYTCITLCNVFLRFEALELNCWMVEEEEATF